MAARICKFSAPFLAAILLSLGLAARAAAQDEVDLSLFDLEDLVSIEVTSVSKKAERAFEAPAAAFVITSEDIRRSGIRTVPELMRLVPGAQVAQLNSNFHAISIRGFSGSFSSKLLVLIDGRSVYTPLFAGVFWGVQDLPLADIDRIEVIRGPGGTVWGANAVNGVINIVTKSASETQGWHVEVEAGEYERAGSGMVRYGGNLFDKLDFRLYVKHFDREAFDKADKIHDGWDRIRTGFRMDADVYEGGHLTLQGDLYDGKSDGVVAGERTLSTVGGGNALARFTHEFSDTHNVSAQLYYDRTDRNLALLLYELDTIDLELKHQFEPLPGLDFVWGVEYRYQNDDSKTGIPATADMTDLQALFDGINFFSPGDAPATAEALTIDPSGRKTNLFSGFAQLEGRAFDEQLRATLGTKLEDNSYSGFEIQPSARVAYVPNNAMTFWTSVSRAVRTPSRANQDITTLNTTNNGIPVLDLSNDDFVSEELMAYEAGFRIQPHESVHFDVAGFYNDYDNLELTSTTDAVRIVPPGLFLLKRTQGNHAKGEAWGIELFTRVQIPLEVPALKQWTVDGTYSFIDVDVKRDSGVAVPKAFGGDNADATGITEANHTVGLRSRMSLACNLEFDLNWFYVSRIKDVGPGDNDVESYHRVDLRAAWLPTDNVETSVVVQNLFEAAHREWNTELFVPATKIPRTVYGKVVLKF